MLLDTDVIIWYMRGNEGARRTIENLNEFYLSAVSYIELVQGMRNKQELNALRKALRSWQTKILFINEEVSVKAMFLIERHFLSHSFQLADALIASTALVNDIQIMTGNYKHFMMIKELKINRFRP